MSSKAVEFIQERGGRLYVRADDDAGLEHVRTESPDHPVDFAERSCDGFVLYVDRTITAPLRQWTIVYHHFPFRHPRHDARRVADGSVPLATPERCW